LDGNKVRIAKERNVDKEPVVELIKILITIFFKLSNCKNQSFSTKNIRLSFDKILPKIGIKWSEWKKMKVSCPFLCELYF